MLLLNALMLTCKLPFGQYSVKIATFDGSTHAPTNLVKLSWLQSLICCKDPVISAGITSINACLFIVDVTDHFQFQQDGACKVELVDRKSFHCNQLPLVNTHLCKHLLRRSRRYVAVARLQVIKFDRGLNQTSHVCSVLNAYDLCPERCRL